MPASAVRPSFLPVLCFGLLLSAPEPAAAQPLTLRGTVLDASGTPLARALVRITDDDGRVLATTYTGADGTFRQQVESGSGCRLHASLLGFQTAAASCSAADLTLTLAVAPVREAIVVTATRGDAPAGQLAASVTVIDEAEISRRHHPPVADLLRASAGTTVVRVGAPGSVTSLFVRGGESNYNKVLLDGVPINEPGGTFNFSNVTSHHLDRVELVRGAQSALYGSDAMSSVVQLFTKRAHADGTSGSAAFEGGTHGTFRASAGVAGRHGDVDYSLGAARLVTDNEAPNNAFRNTTISGAAGIALSPGTRLRFVGRGEFGWTGVPGATLFGRPDMDAFFDRRDGVAGATFRQTLAPGLEHRATYGFAISKQQSTNLLADPPYTPAFEGRTAPFEFFDFPYDLANDLRRHHAAYQLDWRLPARRPGSGTHLLTLAAGWDGERATLDDRLAGTGTRARRDNFGWTVQHQALWSRVFATTGVRVEANDSFGGAVVPRVSIAYVAREGAATLGSTRLKAAAGLGIKEPTILQSFSTSPFFLGNPELEPERSRSLESGVEQRLLGDRAKVELTWFHNRFRDIISTRTLSFTPFVAQYFNVGLTRARGAEVSVDLAPGAGLRLAGSYTFLDSRILESTSPFNPVFAEGQPLFQRPRHSGHANLAGTFGGVTVDLLGRFTGRRADSDFSSLEPPLTINRGYAVWDLRGSCRLTRRLAVTGAIDNLLGRSYMEPLGYPALGRTVRLGGRAEF